MMMLRIAAHEFRYMFRSLPTLMVASVFFFVAFLFTANGVEFQSTARGGNVFINSPYIIAAFLLMLSVTSVFIAPAYVANSVLKDVENRFDGILFSTPVTKKSYVFGRFLGSFAALATALAAGPLGLVLGAYWPFAVPETLTVNQPALVLAAYLGFMVPTLFTVSAVVFAAAVVSRSMMAGYLAALGLLILYMTVAGSNAIPSIWDPFMIEVYFDQTQFWTAAERNARLLEYHGPVLANRLLWLGIAVSFLALTYRLFSFRAPSPSKSENPVRMRAEARLKAAVDMTFQAVPDWKGGAHIRQLLYRTRFEMTSILKSMPFLLLMGFCLFLLFFSLTGRETLYDVNTYPLTRILLGAIKQSLTLALTAILAFYSADVMWRERSHQFNEIIDALPTPNWVYVVSKIAALALVMYAVVLLGVVLAITLQIAGGYYHFQLDLYLSRGLIFYPLPYVFLTVMTCFFQVIAKNRVIGILGFVAFTALLTFSRDIFGVEHILISYGLPGIAAPLSDMNGQGRFAVAGSWARVYWGAMAGMLMMLTHILWNRGTLQPLKYRLRNLRVLKTQAFALPGLALLTLFIASGSYIFYNTNVLNTYRTADDIERLSLDYERLYRQYEDLPMPRIIDVSMDVDIYPYKRRVEARSRQILQNKTGAELNTIHLTFPIEVEVTRVQVEGAVQKSADTDLAYYIFDLKEPMAPGEKRELTFETVMQQRGFKHARPDIRLVRNGSYIGNHHLTPYIGFVPGHMISDRNTRRKHGLDPLPRMPQLENEENHHHNYLRRDSDFINFQTTVSTVADQTAISPGYLVREWTEGDRRYFTYKMDAPIMNFYSYVSAEYEVTRDKWNEVAIEVFHHGPHNFNIERMIQSAKDSLAYYSQAFGPYQYRQLRILEFPAYRTSAQAFPNTIPFSEGIGFIADLRDPHEFDLPYYVTAHEVAHQWWAHQVMAANVQGGTMLIETMAQYSALMVMEQHYGPHRLRGFLKMEQDKYLRGRAGDAEGELPLYKVENQAYIHYRKGAVIMVTLKDYLGEAVVNRALGRMVKNHAYQSNPYAVSTDFLGYLKEEADPKLHALIEDSLEKITLYDVKVQRAEVLEMKDGRYKVTLDVDVAKFYADAQGNETQTPFDLPVDIGLFQRSPADKDFSEADVILFEKRSINPSDTTLELIVDEKPTIAGIDPYNKLIDRNTDDNLKKVEQLSGKS